LDDRDGLRGHDLAGLGVGRGIGVRIATAVNLARCVYASPHGYAANPKDDDDAPGHLIACKPHAVLFEKSIATHIMPALCIKKGRRKPSFLL
jgi:hypothetical protein